MTTLKKIIKSIENAGLPVYDYTWEAWTNRRNDAIKYGHENWRKHALADILLYYIGEDNAGEYAYQTAIQEELTPTFFADKIAEVEELNKIYKEEYELEDDEEN